MNMLRAPVVVFAFGLISLFAASRAHTQNVSLQAELLKDWSQLKITMHKIARPNARPRTGPWRSTSWPGARERMG